MTYEREQVSVALNRAADELLVAIDAPDEGKRDLANAIVNVAMHYLDFPDGDLGDAIGCAYQEDDPEVVLGWCRR